MDRSPFSRLSSLRTTIFLILSLGGIFLLGLWIPQKGLLNNDLYIAWKAKAPGLVSALELLGLTDIYTSPVTLALWLLFFINLSLVMWKRAAIIRALTSAAERKPIDPVSAVYTHRVMIGLPPGDLSGGADLGRLSAILGKEGYRMYGTPERFYAVRNRLSPYATLLFHLSFFLMLIGGVVGVYTKFEGTLDLAEGEEFNGEPERYNGLRLPKAGRPPELHFSVETARPETVEGRSVGVRVTINDASGKGRLVEVNRPYESDGASLVIKDLGVSPLFVISDAIAGNSGRELDGAYVKLSAQPDKKGVFSMAGLNIETRFFPDYEKKYGKDFSRSNEIKNPAYNLSVKKDGKVIGQGTVRPGEILKAGDYDIEFREMRYWVRFYAVKEYGGKIVFAGFFFAIIALVLRLFFYRRELAGMCSSGPQGTQLQLAGRSEFYKALYEDEFTKLAERLKREL